MTTMTMPTAKQAEAAPAGRGKKLLLALLVLVVVAGAAAWFLLKPAGQVTEEPVAGEVVSLEAVQVNLAAGHYLRLGIALQLTETAHEVDGSKALDAAISIFSGRDIAQVTTAQQRENLRTELTERLDLAYEGDVMGVYFTEFVTQ